MGGVCGQGIPLVAQGRPAMKPRRKTHGGPVPAGPDGGAGREDRDGKARARVARA